MISHNRYFDITNSFDLVISQNRFCDIKKIEYVISKNTNDFLISQILFCNITNSVISQILFCDITKYLVISQTKICDVTKIMIL